MIALALFLGGCTTPAVQSCHIVSFTHRTLQPATGFADTSNLRAADMDGDGRPEVLVTHPLHGMVDILAGCPTACTTRTVGGLGIPVRTAAADMDKDGRVDLLVADIGVLPPADTDLGRILLLHALANGSFETKVLLAHEGRTACAEPADLDGDGDLDISVCVFGHQETGELGWLEQDAPLQFRFHTIAKQAGTIVALPADVDGDGDLDLVASVAQSIEQVQLWRNDGHGTFESQVIANGAVTFYGMSGLITTDLDRDGDLDVVAMHGDAFDGDLPPGTKASNFYGAFWLENRHGSFERHELTTEWGIYGVAATDVDHDGDPDLVFSTFQLDAERIAPPTTNLLWLENDGTTHFVRHDVPGAQAQLITLIAADLDGDGRDEILAGSHHPDGQGGTVDVVWEQPAVAPCPSGVTVAPSDAPTADTRPEGPPGMPVG